jgi:hypothetical protein
MAQDPNQVMRTSRASGASTTSLSSPSDTEHLRRQIADTRAGMTNTIDAIQDRVNPRSVMNRTLASIKSNAIDRLGRMRNFADSAGSAAGYVAAKTAPVRMRAMRATREHPAQAAMIGAASAAAVWMMIRSLRNGRRRDYLYDQAL